MSTTTATKGKKSAVFITTDLKKKAQQRAKGDEMSVSAVVRILLKDYANGYITLGTRFPQSNRDIDGFTPEKAQEFDEVLEDSRIGKNISPGFENVEDAISFLQNNR